MIPATALDELGIARAMAAGELTSPQRYSNLWLFDLRVTGTGAAYRRGRDEFVWRDPSFYLNDDFVARCNGLPVIVEHPDRAVLDGQEFVERVIGTLMLPYIKADEIWAVAKIYDEQAAAYMAEHQLSTSPNVVFAEPGGGTRMELEDGATLLFEGRPALLDHLAICGAGVWDKGQQPNGINIGNVGDSIMTEAEKKAAEDKARQDAEENNGVKLDKLLTHATATAGRLDKLEARMDAMEAEGETEEVAADKARKDSAAGPAIAARLAALEAAARPRDPNDGKALLSAQARADRVYEAFADSAPRPMDGEMPEAYRRRLLQPMLRHSPKFAKIDVASLAGAALDSIEEVAYADALEVATHPVAPRGELREIRKTDRSGRPISEFYGSNVPGESTFIGLMKIPSRRVVKFREDRNAA